MRNVNRRLIALFATAFIICTINVILRNRGENQRQNCEAAQEEEEAPLPYLPLEYSDPELKRYNGTEDCKERAKIAVILHIVVLHQILNFFYV